MNVIMETVDLAKEYSLGKTTVKALKNVSLKVFKGEFLCFMGPSGSGKTTLLNLMGLLDTPTSGQILLEGKQTGRLSYAQAAKLRSRFLGFIFQSFNLFPVLNSFENIEYPLLFFPFTVKERRDRVWEALSQVQLREAALQRPDELSGGQRQRVAIARALVTRPHLIMADEPTANLDSASAESVMEAMQHLNKTLKTTFVFSTHDPRVTHHATQMIDIRDGTIENSVQKRPVFVLSEKRRVE